MRLSVRCYGELRAGDVLGMHDSHASAWRVMPVFVLLRAVRVNRDHRDFEDAADLELTWLDLAGGSITMGYIDSRSHVVGYLVERAE